MCRVTSFCPGSVILSIIFVFAAISESSLFAQYPALPPESNGNANYEWRPDLGGWRDKTTNLVWGYNVSTICGCAFTYNGSQLVGQQYAQKIRDAGQNRLVQAVYFEAQAALETDPVRRDGYLDLAALYRLDAAACDLAATDAGKFSNWRVPTLTEFRSAYNKGLFSKGQAAFNFDATPFTGYQFVNFVMYWTSNPPSRNRRLATVFSPGDGGSGTVGVNSTINVFVVRSGP